MVVENCFALGANDHHHLKVGPVVVQLVVVQLAIYSPQMNPNLNPIPSRHPGVVGVVAAPSLDRFEPVSKDYMWVGIHCCGFSAISQFLKSILMEHME